MRIASEQKPIVDAAAGESRNTPRLREFDLSGLQGASLEQGGPAFSQWVTEELLSVFADDPPHAIGGFITPQMGAKHFEAVEITPRVISGSIGASAISAIQSEALQRLLQDLDVNHPALEWINTAALDVPDRAVVLFQLRRALVFSEHLRVLEIGSRPAAVPFGVIWALVSPESRGRVVRQLTLFAKLLDTSISAALRQHALSALNIGTRDVYFESQPDYLNLVRTCRDTVEASDAILWLKPRHDHEVELSVAAATLPIDLQMQIGMGIVGRCILDSRPILIHDLTDTSAIAKFAPEGIRHPAVVLEQRWKTAICIPLDAGGEGIGVLAVYSKDQKYFESTDVEVLMTLSRALVGKTLLQNLREDLGRTRKRFEDNSLAIQAGMLAVERIHDAADGVGWAANAFELIKTRIGIASAEEVKTRCQEGAEGLKKAQGLIGRIRRLLNARDSASLSKVSRFSFGEHNLAEILAEVLSIVDSDTNNIDVHIHGNRELRASVDREQMERVFLNLVKNAIYFLKLSKRTNRSLEVNLGENEGRAIIKFRDNGPGIFPGDLPRVFETFFSTKASDGMGIGLAIAKNIVQQHDGDIRVNSVWGEGAEFVVTFPKNR